MASYVVQRGDYVGLIAQKLTGDGRRWTELCAANPQLPKHPTAGCVLYAGQTINLPASWNVMQAMQQAAAPIMQQVQQTMQAQSPTVVDMAPSVAAAVQAPSATASMVAPMMATSAPESSVQKNASLIKWGLIAASILMVGGVSAWLLLRNREPGEPLPNPFAGLFGGGGEPPEEDDEAPRANKRKRKKAAPRAKPAPRKPAPRKPKPKAKRAKRAAPKQPKQRQRRPRKNAEVKALPPHLGEEEAT